MFRIAFAASIIVLLSGCKTVVEQRADSPNQLVQLGQPINRVVVTYSASGADELNENAGFDQNELVKSVKEHLFEKDLYSSSARGGETLEIQITSVRYRSTFNAVMWGVMAGSDNVRGEVYLRDRSGKLLNHFEVYSMYALGGVAAGWKGERWPYLYNKFADAVTDHLGH